VSETTDPRRARAEPVEEISYKDLLDAFPAAVYLTDAEGRVTFFNRAAEEMAGRTPQLGDDKWCVTWRLYSGDGAPLSLDECPMAIALKTGQPVRDVDVIAERPNGDRMPVMPFPTPFFNAAGELAGGINMVVDISALKKAQSDSLRRADEQAALYRFTDRLYRAESKQDIYDAALDAILAALRCSRASILLFDDSGVMQFVASRGLSPAYCEAVTGHTPWKPGEPQPEPIHIDDIAQADLPDELKTTVQGEGIGALAFIPLAADGGVIGKFMAYHDAPHAFSAGDLDLGLTIARQLGFAIERKRARTFRQRSQERQRQSEAEFRMLADNIAQLAWMADAGGTAYWFNKRFFDYTGLTEADLDDLPKRQALNHPDHTERVRANFRLAVEAGRPWEDTFPLRGKDGEYRWFLSRALPIHDEDGRVVRWFGTNTDITERLQAEEQRTLLINELNHRVKNTLATVQSLAMQTLREDEQNKEPLALFNSRLATLSRAHDILTNENWKGAQLRQIVDQSIAPFRTTDRIDVGGPDTRVTPKQALALSIVLHELGTNAMKYGALSDQAGRITLAWSVDEGALHMSWRESGGPPVAPPTRRGFGTRLIEQSLSNDLGGEARILYLPAGVVAQMSTPLEAHG
jgi:PAS domain S-box-containing protein